MNSLTTTEYYCLVLRTDFSDQVTWQDVSARITAVGTGEREGFQASVRALDDPTYQGLTSEEILALTVPEYRGRLIFVVDEVTITGPDHPVLVLAVNGEERGQSFRSVPIEIQSVENNLSLYNMDWRDFAGSVDTEGIFRGF